MRPLEGRRLWFVGIGGAGMSAYARIASAWGAEVGGWDRVETMYLEALRGNELVIAPEPVVREGWEVVVSSAYASVSGKSRAEFLAELVSLRDAVVVAGAHGKTTTTGMIAYVLSQLGRDPAFAIGGHIPQLGGNAGTGAGWFVVEGDESDRTIAALRPRVAVVLNVELDHHTEFASAAELEAAFERWLSGVRHVVRDAPAYEGPLVLPGEHNRRNAGAAIAALELVGLPRAEAEGPLAAFTGTGRRFEVHETGTRTIVDDYAHHPAEISATIAATRERWPDATVRVLFQPHLFSRTRHLAWALAEALAAADDVTVTDVYAAREQPVPGVTGKLVVDALSDRGVLAGWTPTVEQGAARLQRRSRDGDVLLVLGAGDVDRAVGLLGG